MNLMMSSYTYDVAEPRVKRELKTQQREVKNCEDARQAQEDLSLVKYCAKCGTAPQADFLPCFLCKESVHINCYLKGRAMNTEMLNRTLLCRECEISVGHQDTYSSFLESLKLWHQLSWDSLMASFPIALLDQSEDPLCIFQDLFGSPSEEVAYPQSVAADTVKEESRYNANAESPRVQEPEPSEVYHCQIGEAFQTPVKQRSITSMDRREIGRKRNIVNMTNWDDTGRRNGLQFGEGMRRGAKRMKIKPKNAERRRSVKPNDSTNKTRTCYICGTTYDTYRKLYLHQYTVHPHKVYQVECGATFKQKCHAKRHIKSCSRCHGASVPKMVLAESHTNKNQREKNDAAKRR